METIKSRSSDKRVRREVNDPRECTTIADKRSPMSEMSNHISDLNDRIAKKYADRLISVLEQSNQYIRTKCPKFKKSQTAQPDLELYEAYRSIIKRFLDKQAKAHCDTSAF